MISTSVKPALREVWIFMLLLFSDVNRRQAGLFYNCVGVHVLPDAIALRLEQAAGQPGLSDIYRSLPRTQPGRRFCRLFLGRDMSQNRTPFFAMFN